LDEFKVGISIFRFKSELGFTNHFLNLVLLLLIERSWLLLSPSYAAEPGSNRRCECVIVHASYGPGDEPPPGSTRFFATYRERRTTTTSTASIANGSDEIQRKAASDAKAVQDEETKDRLEIALRLGVTHSRSENNLVY